MKKLITRSIIVLLFVGIAPAAWSSPWDELCSKKSKSKNRDVVGHYLLNGNYNRYTVFNSKYDKSRITNFITPQPLSSPPVISSESIEMTLIWGAKAEQIYNTYVSSLPRYISILSANEEIDLNKIGNKEFLKEINQLRIEILQGLLTAATFKNVKVGSPLVRQLLIELWAMVSMDLRLPHDEAFFTREDNLKLKTTLQELLSIDTFDSCASWGLSPQSVFFAHSVPASNKASTLAMTESGDIIWSATNEDSENVERVLERSCIQAYPTNKSPVRYRVRQNIALNYACMAYGGLSDN